MIRAQRDFWQRQTVRRVAPAPERRTHIAIADLLRSKCRYGWIWSHIANGELRTEKTGALLQRMGVRRGLFDFLLISPTGQHYWLELKRGTARLSAYQEEFGAALRRCGVPYHVAHSFYDAETKLREWGVIT